jgi:acetylornithine deacetylase/succinyl-diaminopimelate desuccinylase-like protein
MNRNYLAAGLGLTALAAVAAAYLYPRLVAQPPRPASALVSDLSPTRYLKDVTYLASDAMKGRGDGSPELDQAADYIAQQFREAGLKPAGDDNTYFQNFEITTGAKLGGRNELQIAGTSLKIDQDFIPIVFSNTAEFEGPLIFAGYGITAPEYKYDDYSDIDPAGKIVVVFEHEPQEDDPKSVFLGKDFTAHSSFTNKAINARLHGAKGIVFITEPSHGTEELGPTERQVEESDMGIPAVHVKRDFVMKPFKAGGKDLAALQKAIDKNLKPQSFELPGIRAHIATEVTRVRRAVRNVVAAFPGSDPALKDQWIVIGAHYDHLGLGNRNSLAPSLIGQVHHGADDNASGASGVIELARLAAASKPGWKRSVLFMAFAGEEIGLLGSSYFVNHSTVPLKDIDAMINMDMIGRLKDNRLYVSGVGTSPPLKPDVEGLDKEAGLDLTFSESGYGSSDHTSFNAKKIPVLFFYSGLHTDYHKPSDTADKINAPGAVKVLSLVYLLTDRLATEEPKLAYNEVQQPIPASRGGGRGYGPYFGSVPDFRDDIKGVLFSDVQNNSPAAKAGLKAGDLMVEFDGKTILNLNDYAYALRGKKPGDIVSVVVKRSGEDVKTNVTLEARR